MDGLLHLPACLPFFLPSSFLSQSTPLSWDPMMGFKLPMVVIKAPTRIPLRFVATTFNTSGMIRNLRTDRGRLRWAPRCERLTLLPCMGPCPAEKGQAA